MVDGVRALWHWRHLASGILVLLVTSFNNWALAFVFNRRLLFHAGSVSELSANTQPHAWVFRSLDIASGICMAIFACLAYGKMEKSSKVARWLVAAVLILGVANIIDAILPLHCSETLQINCVERVNLSLTHFAIPSHGYSSVAISLGYFVLPMAGFLYARQKRLPHFSLVSLLTVAVSLVSLFSAIAGFLITRIFSERALGPSQELQMLVLGLWFISFYLAVFRRKDLPSL